MMAVVRARAGRGPLEKAFDSAALAKDAARLGAADFARFRRDFLSSGTFHEPSPLMFDVLRRRRMAENAHEYLFALEIAQNQEMERAGRDGSGLGLMNVDTLRSAEQGLANAVQPVR